VSLLGSFLLGHNYRLTFENCLVGARYRYDVSLTASLASEILLASAFGRGAGIRQAVDQEPDRANSLKSEKKRAQTASPLLVLHAPTVCAIS